MKNTVWKNTKKKNQHTSPPSTNPTVVKQKEPSEDRQWCWLPSAEISCHQRRCKCEFFSPHALPKKVFDILEGIRRKKKKMEKESEWTSLTAFSPSLPLGKSAGTNLCSCCVELVRYFLTECFPVRKCSFALQYLYFWKFLVFLKPYSFIFLNVQTCSVWVSPRLLVQLQTELRKLWCWAESASTCRRPITIF